MRWRFYLIDRYQNKTHIEEPIGWDAFTIKTKRHPERHGTFREIQAGTFKFVDQAADLLRTEHKQYGIRGNYQLKIDGKCNGQWTEMFIGKVGFDNYKFTCDTGCSVSVAIEQKGALIKFINRFDQKVDLSSEVAFDGATALTHYPKLNQLILLPSKAILLRTSLTNTVLNTYKLHNDSGWYAQSNNPSSSSSIPSTGTLNGVVSIPFLNQDVNAVQKVYYSQTIDFYNNSQSTEYAKEIIFNDPSQSATLSCIGTLFHVEFRIKGRYKNLVTGSGNHSVRMLLKNGFQTFYTGASVVADWFINSGTPTNAATFSFDITYTGDVQLLPGEKLWLNPFIQWNKNTDFPSEVIFEFDPETFFKASVISKCDPTTSKFYLINETVSRVMESITDNELKLYSEYYGRTDSQPFSFPGNGCGGLRAITPGLEIRKAKLSDGTDPKFFLSMKDIFESLSAIDNIGIGEGEEGKIRIEPWTFFYQPDIIFYARGIDKLEDGEKAEDNWSVFKTGYDKWEAEDYNGLDEFLTRREYRTALSEVQNPLEKICKWIASGYAFEVTRRRVNDTKDWRYDNDTFLLCLMGIASVSQTTTFSSSFFITLRNIIFQPGRHITITGTTSNNVTGIILAVFPIPFSSNVLVIIDQPTVAETVVATFSSPDLMAETGNINSASNILDPDTVYNFRISPERNAMRWFNRIAQCYRNITTSDKLIFSSGDGNFLAEGDLDDTTGCKLEAGLLKENQDISLATFDDQDNGKPILRPERVVFTYPVSFTEFNQIMANPYGLVYYQCKSESGHGWIDEISYNPEDGKAKFSLIPKTNYL